jgi:2-polyprenyl-3-methyl-5-hydroxy-6-metoxy-1,4-benzoquinol methylase
MHINAKTDKEYWNNIWVPQPRMTGPAGLFVEMRNIQKLLKRCVTPGMRVLEIGCASGKILAWVAKVLRAEVSGLDYSPRGIENSKLLFDHLGISGDLRCEDVFETSFEEGSFDCVFSFGLIEHFNDPRQIVTIHVSLLKPGGKALMTVPNYAGIYGRVQRYFDSDNLYLHNLNIMNPSSLAALAPSHLLQNIHSYPFGRLNSALISFGRKLPRWIASGLAFCFNTIGLLQPFDIQALCPLLVLQITRKQPDKSAMEISAPAL